MSGAGRLLRTVLAAVHAVCGWLAYRLGWHDFARQRFEQVLLLRGADFAAYVHLGRIAFDLGDYAGWRREFEHARRLDPNRFARLRHPLELFEPRLAGTRIDLPRQLGEFDATGARATWRAVRPLAGEDGTGRAEFGGVLGGAPDAAPDSGVGADLDALLPDRDPFVADPRASDLPQEHRGSIRSEPKPPPRPQPPDAGRHVNGARLPDASMSHDDCVSPGERRRFRERGPISTSEIARCDLDELSRRLLG